MEKLIKNISKLVASNDCVIIPGVGAFLAHQVPARYNAEDNIFMPPHRALIFNPQIKVDDMLLLSEYLAGGKLSYSEALSAISKAISNFKKELSAKGTLRFGDLGTFSMNVKGELSFVPSPNGIDDPYNFGFEPLSLPLLSDLEKKDIVISRNSIRKYIAVAASIAVAFFVVAPFASKVFSPSMQASISDIAPSVSTVAEPSYNVPAASDDVCNIAPVDDTITETIITEEDTLVENIPAEANVQVEPTDKFYVIVASSPNAKNAEQAVSELSLRMEAAYTVVEGDRRFRIAYGCYASMDEAAAAISSIKDVFPDAWVYQTN